MKLFSKRFVMLSTLILCLAALPATRPIQATAPGYAISPTSGPPGTVLTFTGTGCLPRSGPDGTFVFVDKPLGAFTDQLQTIFESGPDGSFTGTMTLPATEAPGTYSTGLGCYLAEMGWPADAAYQRFTVTTPAPTPRAPTPAGGTSSSCPPNPSPANTTNPAIVVNSPMAGAHVTSPVPIAGRASVFEAVVNLKIFDSNGTEIANGTAMASEAGPLLAPFSTTLAYSVAREQPGCIWVFAASAKDGSPTNVVPIPVILSASSIVPPKAGDGGLTTGP